MSSKIEASRRIDRALIRGITDSIAFVDKLHVAVEFNDADDLERLKGRWPRKIVCIDTRDDDHAPWATRVIVVAQPNRDKLEALRDIVAGWHRITTFELAVDVLFSLRRDAIAAAEFFDLHRWHSRHPANAPPRILVNSESGHSTFYSADDHRSRVHRHYLARSKAAPESHAAENCFRIEERLRRNQLGVIRVKTISDAIAFIESEERQLAFWSERLRLRAFDDRKLGAILDPCHRNSLRSCNATAQRFKTEAYNRYLSRVDAMENDSRERLGSDRRYAIEPLPFGSFQVIWDHARLIDPSSEFYSIRARPHGRPKKPDLSRTAIELDSTPFLPRRATPSL